MHGRAHAVSIVLADVNHRQVPQLRHVPGLEELTLRRRAVSVQCEGHSTSAVVLVRQRDAGADRYLYNTARLIRNSGTHPVANTSGRAVYLSADDAVAAVKVGRIHVHGATLALGGAGFATHELR